MGDYVLHTHILLCLSYLGEHHMAVKSAFSVSGFGSLDMRSDLSDNGSAKGHVGYEVAVHLRLVVSVVPSNGA